MAPIASHLEQAGIETLLYAADGPLRYIPLAALHDGEQWLAQRYTLNHITAASLTDFSRSEAATLDVLAGAFPEDAMQVTINGDPMMFTGLPYAQAEVDYLVENLPNTTAFFDHAFSREAIEAQFNNYRPAEDGNAVCTVTLPLCSALHCALHHTNVTLR